MSRQLTFGKGLVLLACLMVLLCMNQRAVGKYLFAQNSSQGLINTDQASVNPSIFQSDKLNINSGKLNLSSCELSAKSLLTLLPSIVEPISFLLIAITALSIFGTTLFSRHTHREKNYPPPNVRLHLQFCNLRD